MSDIVDTGSPSGAALGSSAGDSGGLIDVSGMRLDELFGAIGAEDLNRALDYILASNQNVSGYHGFNSNI